MTYLGLALLAVGMWAQQQIFHGSTNGTPMPPSAVVSIEHDTRTVVPAVKEEQEYGLATCRQAPECEGKPTCNLATCKRATRPYWICPDKSNYELHSTVDGSKHWCERAPEVAK